MDTTTAVTNVAVAIVSGGGVVLLRDAAKAWQARRRADSPEGRASAALIVETENIAVVAKARDELAEDNVRLRVTLAEERRQHAEDRAEWSRERAEMRAEITTLEGKVRLVLAELEAFHRRYSAD